MQSTALSPSPSPALAGVVCAACNGSRFTSTLARQKDGARHVRLTCTGCGKEVHFVEQGRAQFETAPPDAHQHALAPPPADWRWVGMIRQSDRVWRAVAEAGTLEACWDCLLTYPGLGDRLCVPTKPEYLPLPEKGKQKASGFVGWLRVDGEPWRACVDDPDSDTCYRKLLAHPRPHFACNVENLVLPCGERPRRARIQGGTKQ